MCRPRILAQPEISIVIPPTATMESLLRAGEYDFVSPEVTDRFTLSRRGPRQLRVTRFDRPLLPEEGEKLMASLVRESENYELADIGDYLMIGSQPESRDWQRYRPFIGLGHSFEDWDGHRGFGLAGWAGKRSVGIPRLDTNPLEFYFLLAQKVTEPSTALKLI